GGGSPGRGGGGVSPAPADPGSNPDGSPRFVTINGSSAAAAVVAGAAALLAQARPSLGASAMDGLLAGAAQPLPTDPVTSQGAGLIDVGAATAGEVAASPATLALGRSTGAGWRVSASFTLTNLSTRPLNLTVGVRTQDEGAAAVDFHTFPSRFSLRPGHSRLIRITAITAWPRPGPRPAAGTVVVAVQDGGAIRVPWAIAFGTPDINLIPNASLSARTFGHSDTRPALLSIDAGRVLEVTGKPEIEPVSRLDVMLKRSHGTTLRLLAPPPDVLPRPYTFRPPRPRPPRPAPPPP